MLSLDETQTSYSLRQQEWAETLNSEAPIMTDRNTALSSSSESSIWTKTATGSITHLWEGSVVFNDNHALYSNSFSGPTRYGNTSDDNDGYFATGDGPASMVYQDGTTVYGQN